MMPMCNDVQKMYVWKLNPEMDDCENGYGSAEYVREDTPVNVYFTLDGDAYEMRPQGKYDKLTSTGYIRNRTDIALGDCLGTAEERTLKVVDILVVNKPYKMVQMGLVGV